MSVTSKCWKIPQSLIFEILTACPRNSLKSIKLYRCQSNLDSHGWNLINDRAGNSLLNLVLTPSAGPNTLGWEKQTFEQNLAILLQKCFNLKKIDLSGHALGIAPHVMDKLIQLPEIEEIYLSCGINDSHLLAMTKEECKWRKLKTIGIHCMCIDGEQKERRKICCNKFSDRMLIEFCEKLSLRHRQGISIFLPMFITSVRTGKPIETNSWLSSYQTEIILSVPKNRMLNFF